MAEEQDLVLIHDPNGRPGLYDINDIYDPDNPPLNPSEGKIVPVVGSVITAAGGTLYYVTAVAAAPSYKATLVPCNIVVTDQDASKQVSIVDYGNNTLRIYQDTRNSPTRLQPSLRMGVRGITPATYQLIKDRGTENETVISRYYDTDGDFISTQIPMIQVLTDSDQPANLAYGQACHTLDTLVEDTKLDMVVYDDHGAEVASISAFVRNSAILNEAPGYQPKITSIYLVATQERGNNEFFLQENQDPDSLNVQVWLGYDDGNQVQVTVDSQKCFMYGLEDFVASWQGLRQEIMVKYYLSDGELVDPLLTDTSFITATYAIVVVPNDVLAGVKISTIPYWSIVNSRYQLQYFMYTTDRDVIEDVTPYVTIYDGAFVGTQYGTYQTMTLSLDLNEVDPATYPESTIHYQTVSIQLQPIASTTRYIIRDTPSSEQVYGVDSTLTPRPVIRYDTVLEKYFVPSTVFLDSDTFIESFYTKATPPFDPDTEEGPVAPTHFTIRDVLSSAAVIAAPIAIADYDSAWSVIGTPADRFVGANVVVEFLYDAGGGNYLKLYGAPVDVYESETGYV